MMEQDEGANPIDVFLRNLGIEVEQPKEQLQSLVSIRIIFERSQGQFTFTVGSITRFAEIVEEIFTRAEVAYHRSMPLLPARGEPLVSYGLVPRMIDKDGTRLYSFVRSLFNDIFSSTQGNLTK